MKRARTYHFFISGALGGLVGFFIMEEVRLGFPTHQGGPGAVLGMALQFSAFGLATGAALGMTEAIVQKRYRRLVYGLLLGLTLGAIGGFAGGAVGETIFQLLPRKAPPEPPGVDLAIALDSSGSMKQEAFFGLFKQGNDMDGQRLKAAQKLVDLLGPSDRVAIIAFNDTSQALLPLTSLGSNQARERVRRAIQGVGHDGGTNLNAGLSTALAQLTAQPTSQAQYVIFLTDGVGAFESSVLRPALDNHIKIYTIGLGSGVQRHLMEEIANATGGAYYPVENAGKVWQTFEKIYKEELHVDMAGSAEKGAHDPLLLLFFRMLSWGAMGLVIGLGQGIRENTREDLLACSLGGLVGGLVGGAVFDPIISVLQFGSGMAGRALAEVTVGACIGGSMRFAQGLVVAKIRPTKSLITLLPQKSSSLVAAAGPPAVPTPQGQLRASGMRGLVLSVKQAIEMDDGPLEPAGTASSPAPISEGSTSAPSQPAATGRRKPLSFYQSRYPDNRPQAMAAAFQSGHYSLGDLAEFFQISESRVQRAIEQFKEASR